MLIDITVMNYRVRAAKPVIQTSLPNNELYKIDSILRRFSEGSIRRKGEEP